MRIMMIPGERNEELIEQTLAAIDTCKANDDSDYGPIITLIEQYGVEEVYDALYYACSEGDAKLTEQANYFYDQICYDEVDEFIDLMIGI